MSTPARNWTWNASDGYPVHVTTWEPDTAPRGRIVLLHGVQSHAGWYHNLGQVLSDAGFVAHFPDRRGSGSNQVDRGDTPSMQRLLDDVSEFLAHSRAEAPEIPTALAGISWGGKLAVLTAANHPEQVDALALICPGLQPRVGVSRWEKVQIAFAYFLNPTKRFPIPLSNPALFTANPEGQAFIKTDPLSLRDATARLLAASSFIDRAVRRAPGRVNQPSLLMLAGLDRIVDNQRTRKYYSRLASPRRDLIEYPEAHHTPEFDADPSRYARDLAEWVAQALPARG